MEVSVQTEVLARELALPAELRPYQWEGVRFLLRSPQALLADEMGLGKTVEVAVAVALMARSKECRRCLIVCPAALCHNWAVELLRWAKGISHRVIFGDPIDRRAHYRLPFTVWITSYEQARADIEYLRREEPFDLVVLDEAQRIKNADTGVAMAARQLLRSRAWALSGTPVENRAQDLLSLFAFLKPGLLHSALSLTDTRRRITPFYLRRKKSEVMPELPPVIAQDLFLEMQGSQRDAYDDESIQVRDWLRQHWQDSSNVTILAQITRLKLICNFDPESGDSCKLDALLDITENLQRDNDKLIVFSQYVDTLRRIRRRIESLPTQLIHGGLDSRSRLRVVKTFEQSVGPRVLLVSLKAGGVGLNIGSASTVVLFDRWWNPAAEQQAIHRAHRFGRTEPLHVIRFLIPDTIEERIAGILSRKERLFEEYVEGLPVGGYPPFTRTELLRILGTMGPELRDDETTKAKGLDDGQS